MKKIADGIYLSTEKNDVGNLEYSIYTDIKKTAFFLNLTYDTIRGYISKGIISYYNFEDFEIENNDNIKKIFSLKKAFKEHLEYCKQSKKFNAEEIDKLKALNLQVDLDLKLIKKELETYKAGFETGKYFDIETIKSDYSNFMTELRNEILSLPQIVSSVIQSYIDVELVRKIEKIMYDTLTNKLKEFVLESIDYNNQNEI